ncbi:UDP-N-acetylglucosamine 2-epimerase [Leptospira borgpetersenii]|uniref:UDP-N-acetylglucosamine 2-epimerase n=1 Tax=Leptospira borgpetersenii TaxID=174 RepID=UPI000774B76C|nr:UDP-N-acetylglucosamine 2-epimerase [Leptospira borgpetersenii]MBE8400930.1 UDP-N-acetylglucosamine 2-epimerase (hydrolyzing) [Leptospira borgpetersenii serovar Tarassovi]MBE8403950.1 UDP-N-acetylglucosamine 2-epimerase (hydrolyzing) [Leptospira borgpetersenii serovar Tarassovi]MBE8406948.1 UDP-N-acetylglucosamine 2-epimerase (hydrolyzing) [Leptospira borgpetersenii serovar Tarassovi]MBE8412664.1 UDP-N-acetylglucosamine 2-epimerase (hydrolyzing) [Leptospira borgpetersenii serovar Tarassovi]
MKRKVCVVTGTRAEYGLLRLLLQKIRDSDILELQIVATGMHLSPEFGSTYREIENDGFKIDKKVEMLLSADTSSGVSKSIGLGTIGFAQVWEDLEPNLIVVLGDRFEIFSAVSTAMIAKVPIVHIHGGETTEGAFDESIRHSITKMSHIHFTAAEEYKKRVIQLGENPERVYNVGGLGVDSIRSLDLMDRSELESSLGFKFGVRNLLVTFHPETLDSKSPKEQFDELLKALNRLSDIFIIFTLPNADTGSREIIRSIHNFISVYKNAIAFTSLGQSRYFSCVQFVDGVVGNSSSGLLEVPTFQKGTINIGGRQRGRLKAVSIIDCDPEEEAIFQAIEKLYSKEFQNLLSSVKNPYGEGNATSKIVNVLENISLDHILKKKFFDLSF